MADKQIHLTEDFLMKYDLKLLFSKSDTEALKQEIIEVLAKDLYRFICNRNGIPKNIK